ncbi:MAG TPA: 3-mercaptopyruvate sulfurtransferase [Brevundimonas sp.]|uniref:3-mercaptopyruvate sulfurtransferase n=1 Tax=Brevundimonas sp. TaxID=1871086 RepID=UPI002637434A|nr:3-mercaptopyruvate sulfurtransferase [Brevundimonas sp.]HRO32973.1 3-mercaptopyruvate sulfurtransferase [Brevundimonas sp.]
MDPMIATDDLAARLGEPSLKVVDASWHLGDRDGRAEFQAARIPGAVFFDLDVVSDADSPLPHMLPSAQAFAASMGALGLKADDAIVVYDGAGLFSAARAWWMLTVMGARDVRVLDGGLPKWRAEGRAVETGPAPAPAPTTFDARFYPAAVSDLDDVRQALAQAGQVVDARGAARFLGQAPEPRPGLRSGHMPGARNLPYGQLLNADGTLKAGAALEAAFRSAGIDPERPVVTSCGSGVTAAILSLGLARLGRASRLYDGSWAEWGGRADTPAVTGD